MRPGGEKAKPQLRGTVPEQVFAMTAEWPESLSAWSANPGDPQKVQEGCRVSIQYGVGGDAGGPRWC